MGVGDDPRLHRVTGIEWDLTVAARRGEGRAFIQLCRDVAFERLGSPW